MPLERKQQILFKIETTEGVDAAPTGSDAVLIWDPTPPADTVDNADRTPAGASLTRQFSPVGRKSREMTFKTDFRGSGDVSIPITEPDFAKFLKACGYKLSTLKKLTFATITSGTGFEVGEIVKDEATGLIRGVVVGCFVAGTTISNRLAVAGHIAVAQIAGTLVGAAMRGESTNTLATATVADYEGVCLQTTSEKLINFTVDSWTGTAPSATYQTLRVLDAGIHVGTALIINGSGGFLNLDVTMLWGTLAATNTVESVAGGTAVVNGDIAMTKTPSGTCYHNHDGRLRKLLGARSDFVLAGAVGEVMQFAWTLSGDIGPTSDAAPIATSGLSAITPPRLLGANIAYGLVAGPSQHMRLPTKSVEVQGGNVVNPNLDANRAGGSTGSNVTDRDPSIVLSVDQVNSAFDWEGFRDNATPIRWSMLLGSVKGNIVGVVAPRAQCFEVSAGNADGIVTAEATLKPRGITEGGDDELYIFQI